MPNRERKGVPEHRSNVLKGSLPEEISSFTVIVILVFTDYLTASDSQECHTVHIAAPRQYARTWTQRRQRQIN